MAYYLGIDTSNYTSSVAIYNSGLNKIYMQKKLLPVKENQLGLRQSDAVFAHVKQLHLLIQKLMESMPADIKISGVCVSTKPRWVEGSYMPAFLVGDLVATSISAVLGVPKYECSHQDGHIVSALFSANKLDLIGKDFYAFHLSGGTTECVKVTSNRKLFAVELLANTLDLNAGQLIDRVGLTLGLSFPCGKDLTVLALKCSDKFNIKPTFKGNNIHLSGVQNQCEKMLIEGKEKSYIARYTIEYIKSALDQMTQKILDTHGKLPLVYAGGVMSNIIIKEYIEKKYNGIFASPEFSTDNSAGVAIIGSILED